MSAKEKLEEIGSFKDNWNGYGAEAYSEMFIKFASDIIDMLPVEPEVFPIETTSQKVNLVNVRTICELISACPNHSLFPLSSE